MIKRTRKPVSRHTRRFESRGIRRRFNESYFISAEDIWDEVADEEGENVANDIAFDFFIESLTDALENVPRKRDQTLYWMVTAILDNNCNCSYEYLFEGVNFDRPTDICNSSDDSYTFEVNDDKTVSYSWGLKYTTIPIKPADVAEEDGSLEKNKSIIGIAKELSQMPEGYKLSDDDCFEITKKHYPKTSDQAIEYCYMPIAIGNTGCGNSFNETMESLLYELTGDPFYSLLDMVILGL